MFNAGDAVIHPNLGAGKVIGVANIEMQQKKKRFYKIEILGKTKTKVMVPEDKAEDLGLRPAMSSDDIPEIWEILADAATDLPDDNKKRKKVMEDKFNTAEPCNLAELVRDISWRKRQGKTLNRPGRIVFDKAMEFLAGEIAITQDVQMETARAKVMRILNANLSQHTA